MRIIECV